MSETLRQCVPAHLRGRVLQEHLRHGGIDYAIVVDPADSAEAQERLARGHAEALAAGDAPMARVGELALAGGWDLGEVDRAAQLEARVAQLERRLAAAPPGKRRDLVHRLRDARAALHEAAAPLRAAEHASAYGVALRGALYWLLARCLYRGGQRAFSGPECFASDEGLVRAAGAVLLRLLGHTS